MSVLDWIQLSCLLGIAGLFGLGALACVFAEFIREERPE